MILLGLIILARFVAKHVKLWVFSTDNFMVNVTRDLFSSFTSLLSWPHLEYACPVWAPHSHKDTHLIERVQMFGVKIISGEWNAAYHDCLDQFVLVTLERRRLDLSLCELLQMRP